jgi:hypothetical protein
VARGPFHAHLAEAIALNLSRRPLYGRRSGGRSRRLSDLLVLIERASIPVALFFDWRARPFNRRGIPVLEDDFVPMTNVRPFDAPPALRGRSSDADLARLRRLFAGAAADVRAAARGGRFEAAVAVARAILGEIDALERKAGAHLAMSRHIVESIGLAALNAPRWAAMSGGATAPLSAGLIALQCLGVGLAPTIDAMAQSFHALGLGIVVNDVPEIPFLARSGAGGEAR